MKAVVLHNGLCAQVDDEDYERVSAFHWTCMMQAGGPRYAYRYEGGSTIYMHRFIMEAPAGQDVDHKDGNGLNNQRGNLRLATDSHNQANRKSRNKNNSSGYRGIYWDAARQRWRARVWDNGKKITLGRHRDPADAAREYDAWMREHHGEFAVTNFPDIERMV